MLLNNYEISLKFFRTFDETVFNIKSNKDKYKVAQRVLSFKKKTSLTVMNIHSKLLNNQSVHPPLSAGGIETPTKFSKRGRRLTGTQLLNGVCWQRGGDFIQGGCNFHIKINQNLKYLTAKKFMSKNIFLGHN